MHFKKDDDSNKVGGPVPNSCSSSSSSSRKYPVPPLPFFDILLLRNALILEWASLLPRSFRSRHGPASQQGSCRILSSSEDGKDIATITTE